MSDSIFRKKRKSRGWVALLVVALPLYLLLFPYPLGRETVVRPVWAIGFRGAAGELFGQAPDSGAVVLPFRAGSRFGYVELRGGLLYSDRMRYQVALSDAGFINYGSRPEHAVFMDPRGRFQYSVRLSGYPLLDERGGALYAVSTDLSGLARVDSGGETLWYARFVCPLTSVALNGEQCLAGSLDGRARLFGEGGQLLFEVEPSGSRIPVVLGTALARSGEQAAMVAGIDPQQLLLARRREGGFQVERTTRLASDLRHEVTLRFSPSGQFLFVEQEQALQVLEPGRERSGRLALDGELAALAVEDGLAVAAASAGAKTRLVVFRPLTAVIAASVLPRSSAWARATGERLLIGLDEAVLRADVVQR